MARIVNNQLIGTGLPDRRLNPAERRRAQRRLERSATRNPLRRIRLGCHGWLRDTSAVVGDWVWCEACGDLRQVAELAE